MHAESFMMIKRYLPVSLFLYIKNFNASVGEGGYLPQSDRDDEDTLKTAAVFNRAEK
jgi:hypothetical protein